jgi:hypothetical protein
MIIKQYARDNCEKSWEDIKSDFYGTFGQSKGNDDTCTVKPVYTDHPWDPKLVAVVDRWSLFRGDR